MAAESSSGADARDGIGAAGFQPGGTDFPGNNPRGTHSPGDYPRGTVTVIGNGSADAAPDLLVVSIGVECRAGSVEAAYSRAGASSDAVAAAFRRHGVDGADIRSAGLNVRADLAWREGEGQRVTGYVAASTLTVRLRTPGSASAAISEAVEAGGDDVRLNGVELTFSDDAAVRARAREAAWLDAAGTAQQYAQLASARLGRVLSIADNTAVPTPVPLAGMQRAASVESLSVEAGDSTVSMTITAVWELLDPA